MPYVTIPVSERCIQISLDDILAGPVDVSRIMVPSNPTGTRTTWRRYLDTKFLVRFDFPHMVELLNAFNDKHAALFSADRDSLYTTFHIPKKSGGLREINAPKPELMDALRELKQLFETEMYAMYHTSAFAYVKGRCTIDAVKRHQMNSSRWFAKFDFHDFFGSTTPEFVMTQLKTIFPFSEIVKRAGGEAALRRSLSLCFLHGGLPQGTPISPLITNLMMIPIDHQLANELRRMDRHFVYTRYADDILISSKWNFSCDEIQNYLVNTLAKFHTPFALNAAKTRYGSSSGRNWNLGVMLNKDNDITIGYRKKKTFKAMCCRYISDRKNGVAWELHDVQVFAGLISYYRMVEREYIGYILAHYNEKFGVNIENMIRADLAA